MLKIREYLTEALILDDLQGKDKKAILREFALLLATEGRVPDSEALYDVLSERETLGSTGIGEGVAIPHAKLKELKHLVVAFGRCRRGVDFDTLDSLPAYLFFLLVTPEDATGEHLKALARISRLLRNPAMRQALLKAVDRKEILQIIAEEDSKF
jgi:PTS system nitrogen regulatory IIA component